MKRRRKQQVERRRPMADLNLIGEAKGQAVRRKGCASLFGSALLIAAAALSIGLGLR
jgi:hypothetical protein